MDVDGESNIAPTPNRGTRKLPKPRKSSSSSSSPPVLPLPSDPSDPSAKTAMDIESDTAPPTVKEYTAYPMEIDDGQAYTVSAITASPGNNQTRALLLHPPTPEQVEQAIEMDTDEIPKENKVLFNANVQKRLEYSRVCADIFNQPANINPPTSSLRPTSTPAPTPATLGEYIQEFVQTINHYVRFNLTTAVLFGGNAWNHHFKKFMPDMAPDEYCAFVTGNYDVLFLINDLKVHSRIVEYIKPILAQTVENAKATGEFLNVTSNDHPNFGNFYKSQQFPTLQFTDYHSECYYVQGEWKRDLPPPDSAAAKKSSKKDDNKRTLLYIEIAYLPVNVSMFRTEFIDKHSPFLSLYGLFFFMYMMNSSDTSSRARNKLVDVDAIRKWAFIKHGALARVIVHSTKQENIKYLILHTVLTLLPNMFDYIPAKQSQDPTAGMTGKRFPPSTVAPAKVANYFMSKVFIPLIERFNCPISYNPARASGDTTLEIRYSEFENMIGSDLVLNASCGGTVTCPSSLSIRKMVQWFLTSVRLFLGKDCMEIGGDAFAFYDPSVKYSSDIDAKFYYASMSTSNTRAHKSVYIFCITQWMLMLRRFLHTQRFFKSTKQFLIEVGDVEMTLTLSPNKDPDQYVSAVRFIPKSSRFPIDLVSLDVKLMYTIEYTSESTVMRNTPKQPLRGIMQFAPIDISVVQHPPAKEINMEGDETDEVWFPSVPVTSHLRNGAPSKVNLVQHNGMYYGTPVASPTWLLREIESIHSDPDARKNRESAGKIEKDLRRKEMMEKILANRGEFEARLNSLRVKMDQIKDIDSPQEEQFNDLFQRATQYYLTAFRTAIESQKNGNNYLILKSALDTLKRTAVTRQPNHYLQFLNSTLQITPAVLWEETEQLLGIRPVRMAYSKKPTDYTPPQHTVSSGFSEYTPAHISSAPAPVASAPVAAPASASVPVPNPDLESTSLPVPPSANDDAESAPVPMEGVSSVSRPSFYKKPSYYKQNNVVATPSEKNATRYTTKSNPEPTQMEVDTDTNAAPNTNTNTNTTHTPKVILTPSAAPAKPHVPFQMEFKMEEDENGDDASDASKGDDSADENMSVVTDDDSVADTLHGMMTADDDEDAANGLQLNWQWGATPIRGGRGAKKTHTNKENVTSSPDNRFEVTTNTHADTAEAETDVNNAVIPNRFTGHVARRRHAPFLQKRKPLSSLSSTTHQP